MTGLYALDTILATQLLVAWAGEACSQPKRLGWWETDLVDEAGGGDLLARLAPRTHVWRSLELVREAARRVDAKARRKHGTPDQMRSLFFLGYELDEQLGDRLADLRRGGDRPEKALPLPFALGGMFDEDRVLAVLAPAGKVAYDEVLPVGRQLKGALPKEPAHMVAQLSAALLPPAEPYPLPFFKVGA